MKYNFEEFYFKRKDNGMKLYVNKTDCIASYPEKNILIVHGLTSSNHIFDMPYKDYSIAKFLAQNGYTVWKMDIGGYGLSDKYEDGFKVTTKNAAEDILTVTENIIELQNVENIDVFGWSWGTMTTALADSKKPEYFRKLVWAGPCFGDYFPPTKVEDAFTTLTYPYVSRVFQHIKGSDLDVDYDTIERELTGIWCEQVFKIDAPHGRPNGGNRDILEAGDKWLIDVESVKAPTIILCGTNDQYYNVERTEIAREKLPKGSEVHIFRGAGHALFYELDYYKPFREKMIEFLQK